MDHQKNSSLWKWLGFNLFLIALYLAFFYQCLLFDFPVFAVIGILMAIVGLVACLVCRHLFINVYEFVFYLAIPLDMALEALIPIHAGYSFFWCAVSFWVVFAAYRIYRTLGSTDQTQLTKRN